MLGGSASSGWGISTDSRSSPLSSGSVDMDPSKATPNVWGSEEAFLSPSEYGGILAASTESEESSEDCEDYACGLAEEIAQSMLQEQEVEGEQVSVKKSGEWSMKVPDSAWSSRSHKMGSSPTSPQSILSGLAEYQWGVRSHKGSSGMSSPRDPQEGDPMELLHEELLRVKLENEVKRANRRHLLSLQQQIIRKPFAGPTSHAQKIPLSSAACNSHISKQTSGGRGRYHENLPVAPKDNVLALAIDRAMMVKQGRQQAARRGQGPASAEGGGAGRAGGGKRVGGEWGGGVPAAFQQQQQQAGGGSKRREGSQQQRHFSLFASNEAGPMRAVFLGSPAASRECGGTGVFLPRRLGSIHHHRLHQEDAQRKPDSISSHHPHHRYAVQKGNHRLEPKEDMLSGFFPMSHSTTLQEVAPNISLPTEWTY